MLRCSTGPLRRDGTELERTMLPGGDGTGLHTGAFMRAIACSVLSSFIILGNDAARSMLSSFIILGRDAAGSIFTDDHLGLLGLLGAIVRDLCGNLAFLLLGI